MYNESFRNPQSLVSNPETENSTNRNETTKQFRRDYVASTSTIYRICQTRLTKTFPKKER